MNPVTDLRGQKRLSATAAVLTAGQVARAGGAVAERFVVVPDFLHYARLLSTGQAGQVLAVAREAGALIPAVAAGGFVALRHPLRAARKDFWVIAEALLHFDLALLRGRAQGGRTTLLLHPYLSDFAFLFDNLGFLRVTMRAAQVRGFGAGFSTLQLPTALSCLSRMDASPAAIHFLPGAESSVGETMLGVARQQALFRSTEWLADLTLFDEPAARDAAVRLDFARPVTVPADSA